MRLVTANVRPLCANSVPHHISIYHNLDLSLLRGHFAAREGKKEGKRDGRDMRNAHPEINLFLVMIFHMGPRRHGQEGARVLSRNVVKCYCTFVVTAKRSVNELLMHYFHNLSSAFEGFVPLTPIGAPSLNPAGGLSSQTPNLPTPGKNPTGTHDLVHTCM